MSDPAEMLSEATRLSILQGRFEALHLGAPQVEPRHLLLGLLKTMDPAVLERQGLDASACATLIAELGSAPDPAPLSPGDIEYAERCYVEIATAIRQAGEQLVEPEHLFTVLKDRHKDR